LPDEDIGSVLPAARPLPEATTRTRSMMWLTVRGLNQI
jgi:hypothetical protein